MSADLTRYSCQIALPGFGEAAQKLLQHSKVLVVGAGGLGCPALQYLVSAGVGTIGVADHDVISVSNLHRQILYTPADAGLKKAIVASERLQKQNPDIRLIAVDIKITSDNVLDIMGQYDIVVDGTDNFETRYLLNDAAVMLGKPLVFGAIYQYEGQVAVWNIKNPDGSYSPNYRDVYPEVDATQIPNCAEGGVIPTLAGIIGCIQANEVIKYITKTGELLSGKILVFDAQSLQSRVIKIGKTTKINITSLVETADIPTITAEDLKAGLAENRIELIDVRTLQERDLFDIGGVHIPVEEIEENITYFDSDSAKVLYCATGNRSAEAVKLIRQKYPDAKIFSLEGGLNQFPV
ncbi:HesA/MoeB/ThiF family protein [Mucilaginibacter sp.]|jgi:adenylyltransferase/sulfurtransferase|uniref:HesA/MoeB/ThiF family protein n=1 Tax=Mucilaginibacter sp. TaxID=1882438 RepID=UPI002CC146F7|nr:HesA/MoeB/ThiF family protein [Mucilaginibacter sp.]HTI61537.1 HesA/MoeB/ThiF family protein [Mucilaginibacter sp.]